MSVLRHKCLAVVAVHRAKEQEKQLIKMVMMVTLGQYLLCFPMNKIKEMAKFEKKYKKRKATLAEYEDMLKTFRNFQMMQLDKMAKELYYSATVLYIPKDPKKLLKLKQQEVMIFCRSFGEERLLYHYSFYTVMLKTIY